MKFKSELNHDAPLCEAALLVACLYRPLDTFSERRMD